MKNFASQLTLVSFLLLLFFACEKDEPIPKPQPEEGYPAVYKALTAAQWESMNKEFQKINTFEGLRLNEFGFVEGEIPLTDNDSLTEEFILNSVESIFEKYDFFLGLPNNSDIDFKQRLIINTPYGVPHGTDNIESFFEIWEELEKVGGLTEDFENIDFNFFINQMFIEGKRFLGPEIHIHFKPDEKKIVLSDNWYPRAFVPASEIYTYDDALPIACRELLKQTGIDFWEAKHEFAHIKIFRMINSTSGTEIRECWRINARISFNTYSDIFIDTQTGEVVSYRERKILL